MSRSKPLKVSGLLAAGKVAPAIGVERSAVFDPPEKLDQTEQAGSHANKVVSQDMNQVRRDHVVEVACNLVNDSPYQNPHRRYDEMELDELGGAMDAGGQREPIQLRRVNDRFELIAGHRRIRAARRIGWATIKALVIEMDDRAAELATLTHNEGRKDLCDYERAKAYLYAIERGHGNQAEIAKIFATTKTNVSRCLSMLKLPPPIIKLLEAQPTLFGIKTTEVINQLLTDYPTEEHLVVQAVERLKDGAAGTSIKPWFEQMQAQKNRSAPGDRPKVITNQSGRQLFTAKRNGRVITVRISASDVDGDETMNRVVESLKSLTEQKFNEK